MNVTQILCLWHVSSHSWVISQCTHALFSVSHTHTHTQTQCCLSIAKTSDHSLSAECRSHCRTEKAIHGALIPAALCAAQLAGCGARLHNAAGPSTFHTPEALLATAWLLRLFIRNSSTRVPSTHLSQTQAFINNPPLKHSRCKSHKIHSFKLQTQVSLCAVRVVMCEALF